MLLKKFKKFKTVNLISEFLFLLFLITFFIFSALILRKIFEITNQIELRCIYSVLFIVISSFVFATVMNYISKLKILNFYKYFNKEEVLNNLNLFNKEYLDKEFISFFQENKELIYDNIKKITESGYNKEWLLNIKLNIEEGKTLLLSKDLDWYSRQVSTRELYVYLKPIINDIIEKEESEYYIVLINLFSDFITDENMLKMKNIINVEQKTLIINI